VEGDELICERLARGGVHVLTFNYRGAFKSEGLFTLSNAVSDVGAALRFVKDSHELKAYPVEPERVVLGGWSFGAAILPSAAVLNPEVSRIFTIAGRNFGEEARKIKGDPDYAQTVKENLAAVRFPNGPLHFDDTLFTDMVANGDSFDPEKLAPSLADRDILLIGAWKDENMPIEAHILPFYRILLAYNTRKVRIEAFEADHAFTGSEDRLAQVILDWLREGAPPEV